MPGQSLAHLEHGPAQVKPMNNILAFLNTPLHWYTLVGARIWAFFHLSSGPMFKIWAQSEYKNQCLKLDPLAPIIRVEPMAAGRRIDHKK